VRRGLALALGVAAALAAVSPPVHEAVESSLVAHMLQHMALMLLAAPLIAAGAPAVLLRLAPRRYGRSVVRAGHTPCARVAASPWVAWIAFGAVQWTVHVPPVIAAAERSAVLHAALHAVVLGAGVLFWLPVVSHWPSPRPRAAVRVAYLLAAMPVGDALAIWIMSAPEPLYEGVALQEQREAATAMVAGSLVLAAAAASTAWGAVVREHRRQVRREQLEARRA